VTELLEIQHVSRRFPIEGGIFRTSVGFVQAIQDVSLSIEKGETLALVGGSGCGKSTLARMITGLIAADEGEVLWNGQRLAAFSPLERAHRIQMIFQDPYASLNPKLSVGTQLQEVVRLREKQSATSRCIELVNSVGLPADVLSHYPFQFSGGQRQRIAIARALAMKPELLIADEPLSALDVTTQAQMLTLFGQLKASLGLTLLFITHDLAVAEEFADRVVVLRDGQVVEEGPAAVVLRTPKHPYTLALLEAVPKVPC
jgi:ABC-type glutathione transport system ATPase component